MPNNPFPSDCGGKCSQSTRRSWYSETQTFFLLQALNELLEDDDRFGFVIMDGNGSLFGTLCGNTRTILHKFSVDLPKKHGRGGQSALRFARLRLEKRRNYMYVMFLGAQMLAADISNWDTSSVKMMGAMFRQAKTFNTDISDWDVSKVADMRGMFYGAETFNRDLSKWDVSLVADMDQIFNGANKTCVGTLGSNQRQPKHSCSMSHLDRYRRRALR